MKTGKASRKTFDFVKRRFMDYYKEVDLCLPERFGKREFGFMFFDSDFVQRHMSFGSKNEIRQFLIERTPSHVYHSAAYYTRPGAPTMAQKEWLGADLIFDLDADHIAGAKEMTYREMLEEVKKETKKLIDDFLLDDFGFQEKDLVIAFSGGRGYHIHVRDPRVLSLSSHERREIVDFILGTDLDEDIVFQKRPYHKSRFGVNYRIEMPSSEEKGWRGRIVRAMMEDLERLATMEKGEAVTWLTRMEGIGPSTANELYSVLFEGEPGRKGYEHLKRGNLDIFPNDRLLNRFKKAFLVAAKKKSAGKTDEPVTSDIKRLIRLPTSLHGKTAFKVVTLTRSELDNFDPLIQAIPSTWTDEEIVLRGRMKGVVELKGETFNLKDDIIRLPEYAAMFLICRGMATLA